MSYRGSLRKCIEAASRRFMQTGEPMIAITCNPRAKYYSASTMDEFTAIMQSDAGPHSRIVFCGTLREFNAFTATNQLALDFGDEINDTTHSDPSGEQPDDHNS